MVAIGLHHLNTKEVEFPGDLLINKYNQHIVKMELHYQNQILSDLNSLYLYIFDLSNIS